MCLSSALQLGSLYLKAVQFSKVNLGVEQLQAVLAAFLWFTTSLLTREMERLESVYR